MASNLGGKLAVLAAFEGLFDEVEVPSVQAGNVGVTIGGGGGGMVDEESTRRSG